MSGRITDESGPVVGATVVAVHEPTGSQFYSVTDAKGYYRLNSITAGGPYTVTGADESKPGARRNMVCRTKTPSKRFSAATTSATW